MFKRIRYQQGCIARERRSSGPDVWIFRWREANINGQRINRKVLVGTVEEYPTRSAARKAADAIRIHINKETPHAALHPLTCEQLTAHYVERELSEDNRKKAYSTKATYKSYLGNWILPRWRSYRLSDVKAVAVEEWLGSLLVATGTKAKLRNIMSALFSHAIRYEWSERNPISLVRQSAKRERIPIVLDVGEISALLSELRHPYKAMVLLAAATGLRASELLALKWQDLNFESLEINLSRGVVHQVVGALKTEASQKPLPLDKELASSLLEWRRLSPFDQETDWIFASPEMKGEQPYWPENLLRRHIRPAAKRCGIHKTIGWHTFRHSYATLLKANGEDVKVVQESLRHANSRITLDTYTQAVTTAKRHAQTKVVSMILPRPSQTAAAGGEQ
jgi:integrase